MEEYIVTNLKNDEFHIVMCDEDFLKGLDNITYKKLNMRDMSTYMEKNLISNVLNVHKQMSGKDLTDI